MSFTNAVIIIANDISDSGNDRRLFQLQSSPTQAIIAVEESQRVTVKQIGCSVPWIITYWVYTFLLPSL